MMRQVFVTMIGCLLTHLGFAGATTPTPSNWNQVNDSTMGTYITNSFTYPDPATYPTNTLLGVPNYTGVPSTVQSSTIAAFAANQVCSTIVNAPYCPPGYQQQIIAWPTSLMGPNVPVGGSTGTGPLYGFGAIATVNANNVGAPANNTIASWTVSPQIYNKSGNLQTCPDSGYVYVAIMTLCSLAN